MNNLEEGQVYDVKILEAGNIRKLVVSKHSDDIKQSNVQRKSNHRRYNKTPNNLRDFMAAAKILAVGVAAAGLAYAGAQALQQAVSDEAVILGLSNNDSIVTVDDYAQDDPMDVTEVEVDMPLLNKIEEVTIDPECADKFISEVVNYELAMIPPSDEPGVSVGPYRQKVMELGALQDKLYQGIKDGISEEEIKKIEVIIQSLYKVLIEEAKTRYGMEFKPEDYANSMNM